MVCMIADYRENGVDMHNEFIAPHTDDYEKAVCGLADAMQRQGLKVSCITVCPGAQSFADLRRMGDEAGTLAVLRLAQDGEAWEQGPAAPAASDE